MIDLSTLKSMAQKTVNEQGKAVVEIPADLWEEYLAQFEEKEIPQHERIQAVLEWWKTRPDDKSPEWWAEFDQFMKENRFHIPEEDFGFGDE